MFLKHKNKKLKIPYKIFKIFNLKQIKAPELLQTVSGGSSGMRGDTGTNSVSKHAKTAAAMLFSFSLSLLLSLSILHSRAGVIVLVKCKYICMYCIDIVLYTISVFFFLYTVRLTVAPSYTFILDIHILLYMVILQIYIGM